ncbi:DUF4349 domain-containing protein [Occultella glacieicola]|uniref:DUF4349 domain-containing protein n=1 Tax=Occultella glacieicola TaxID=2518684 RepID=A0ABY2E965_9MICO|nr:DUF4349 domain-containing protein [Occultella glacieicola]TDE99032.1 DUF4349 domain-containing protein [Occultella glacieicola]
MRRPRWGLALLLATMLLAGCSNAGSGSGDSGADPGYLSGGDGGGGVAEQEAADRDLGGDENRQIITTGYATVVVDDPAEAADRVALLAETAGGRVDQRSEVAAGSQGQDSPGWASLTIRVPADELNRLIEDLDDLGDVRDLNQTSQDVTQTAVDLDARILALQASTDRLLQIMADAEDSGDLIAAESALSDRQAELESLQAERAYLADQVSMSTLQLQLEAREEATIEAGGFLGGIETGWRALVTFASGLLVFLGVIAPWLLVVGVPVTAIVWLTRRRRRRTTAAVPGAPQPPDDGAAQEA